MLWVDKYRPKTLDHAMVHSDIAQNLKKLVTLVHTLLLYLNQSNLSFIFLKL